MESQARSSTMVEQPASSLLKDTQVKHCTNTQLSGKDSHKMIIQSQLQPGQRGNVRTVEVVQALNPE